MTDKSFRVTPGIIKIFFSILLACLFISVPVSAGESTSGIEGMADNTGFERDEYGLPLRNASEDMPSWYPEDIDSFEFYHDSDVSRVIDKADIFSPEDEEKMAERIAEITADTGMDVVIFTDNSTYGFDRHTYTYDFYDFCGYGTGDTYDGICLFICMDPDNRGFVASATGVVEDMYTETNANEMDDELYYYMKEKLYGDGVLNWIENVNNLYTTGCPFVAEWMPSGKDPFVHRENPDVTRLYDSADIYDEHEEELLTSLLKRITEKYGVDAVIHTTRHNYGMSDEEYAEAFYYYNGYGHGKDFDGILLTVYAGYGNRCLINTYGSVRDKMTEVNHDRMMKKIESELEGDYYYLAGYSFVTDVDHMERTGRVSHSLGGWLLRIIIAAVSGAAVGGISLLRARSKMTTVRAAFNADDYLNGLKNIIPVCDNFIDESVSRTKIVKPTYSSSSSSHSSHSSSYHSHSSGSSGRSHTSSGRSF